MRSAHREMAGTEPQETLLPAVTDCRFYGRYYDIPSLAYGPASTDGHGFDEFVELDSLKEATIVIARFIGEWCGVTPLDR
jgi:acetylornithine deacetylase